MICDKLSKKKLIGSIIALTIIAHIIFQKAFKYYAIIVILQKDIPQTRTNAHIKSNF